MLVAGRYRLHEQVGGGGRSPVWRAKDELNGRLVAVKRVALAGRAAAGPESARDRILREARAAGSGYHPNVVAIFDVVVEQGELWVVQEYLPARTLAGVLADRGPLPAREVAAIGAQVASALAAAHAAGVVHRNVDPGNIVLAWPVVKLDGFADGAPEATTAADPRGDVRALGAALHAAVGAAQAGPLTWPLMSLLAADPAARPTAVQAEAMLRDAAAGLAPPVPIGGGRRGLALGLVIALVAAVIVSGVVVLAPRPNGATVPAPTPERISAPVAPAIGDPRMADPCALVDESALRRHGTTDVEPYAGALTSCWAYVAVRPEAEVVLSVDLMPLSFSPERPGGAREERGPLTLVSYTFDGYYCTRRVHLPDSNVVLVVADSSDGVDAGTVCAVADTGANAVVDRLLGAGLTRRPTRVDRTVLGGLDACGLITVGDLRSAPGVAPTPVPGLANWSCRWGEWAGPNVTVTFSRRADGFAEGETPVDIAGRPGALYRAPSDGGCHVTFPQQRFAGYTESVWVYAYDQRSGADTCAPATAIAVAVAAKLPPPS